MKNPVSKSKTDADEGKPLMLASDLHRHGTHKHGQTHMYLVHIPKIGKKEERWGCVGEYRGAKQNLTGDSKGPLLYIFFNLTTLPLFNDQSH